MTDTPRCAPDEDGAFFTALDQVFRDHPDAAGRYAILAPPPSARGKGRATGTRAGSSRNADGALVLEFPDEPVAADDDAPEWPAPPEKPEGWGDCRVFDYYPGYGIRCSIWDPPLL